MQIYLLVGLRLELENALSRKNAIKSTDNPTFRIQACCVVGPEQGPTHNL